MNIYANFFYVQKTTQKCNAYIERQNKNKFKEYVSLFFTEVTFKCQKFKGVSSWSNG